MPSSPPARLHGMGANFQGPPRCPHPSAGTHPARPGRELETQELARPQKSLPGGGKSNSNVATISATCEPREPQGSLSAQCCAVLAVTARPALLTALPGPAGQDSPLTGGPALTPPPTNPAGTAQAHPGEETGRGRRSLVPGRVDTRAASLLGTCSRGGDARGGHLICGNHQPRCGRGFWGPT